MRVSGHARFVGPWSNLPVPRREREGVETARLSHSSECPGAYCCPLKDLAGGLGAGGVGWVADVPPGSIRALDASWVRAQQGYPGIGIFFLAAGGKWHIPRGTPPHATYLFKHALVRDAAYG